VSSVQGVVVQMTALTSLPISSIALPPPRRQISPRSKGWCGLIFDFRFASAVYVDAPIDGLTAT